MWIGLLSCVSAVVVILVVLILAVGLIKITAALNAIGGTGDCAITELNGTLQAVDREVTPLTSDAVKLNNSLRQARDGVTAIHQQLAHAADAMQRQEV